MMMTGRTHGTRSARGVCPRPRRAMIEEHPLPSFDRERPRNNRDELKGTLFQVKEGKILALADDSYALTCLPPGPAHEIKLSRCDSERRKDGWCEKDADISKETDALSPSGSMRLDLERKSAASNVLRGGSRVRMRGRRCWLGSWIEGTLFGDENRPLGIDNLLLTYFRSSM